MTDDALTSADLKILRDIKAGVTVSAGLEPRDRPWQLEGLGYIGLEIGVQGDAKYNLRRMGESALDPVVAWKQGGTRTELGHAFAVGAPMTFCQLPERLVDVSPDDRWLDLPVPTRCRLCAEFLD